MKNKVFLLAVLASISDVVMAKDFWQCVQANGKTVFSTRRAQCIAPLGRGTKPNKQQ